MTDADAKEKVEVSADDSEQDEYKETVEDASDNEEKVPIGALFDTTTLHKRYHTKYS